CRRGDRRRPCPRPPKADALPPERYNLAPDFVWGLSHAATPTAPKIWTLQSRPVWLELFVEASANWVYARVFTNSGWINAATLPTTWRRTSSSDFAGNTTRSAGSV